jgi:glycosyltransferase involved in cell wall biosynthesis
MSRVGIAHLCRGREWRGGERQVRLLITTLDGRPEFDQHLFTGRSSVLAKSLAGAHGSLVEIPWRAAWDPRAFGLALLGLRRLLAAHPCDLVLHAHDSHALAVGVAASRLLRIPLIATRRSDTVPGRLWRCPDRVVALSGSVEQSLLDGGVALARIVRIPSAVSLDELSRMPGRALDARASDRTPVLIAVGALTPEKDHATLLRALAALRVRLPSARLVLVGEGPQRDPLAALARRLSLGDAVRFEGARADAAALIRDASVLVQPSRREALGTAVLEAMALGTPVVASAVGGLAELLGDGAGLLVPPGDAVAFAEAVARLLTDPPLAGGLTREARARIERYDAPEVAGRVAQVYRSVLQTTR